MKKLTKKPFLGLGLWKWKSKTILALLAICFTTAHMYSQNMTVSGTITDEITGESLFGVNIILKGSIRGVSSTMDGTYSIGDVSPNDVLLFTYLGYVEMELKIGNEKEINVALSPAIDELDELVIVGYGVKKKRNLTGSIVSISSDDISESNLQDPISAIQGRAAGVQVVSNSGSPGGGMSIKVRGNSSLNSGNTPLYVVDGVPIESNSLSTLNGTENFGLNPLADINPNDIQSIEILKDAASTAIYGSRAANGVVLITTKRGKSGKAQVDINISTGISSLTRKLSVLNASQYRDVVIDSYRNMDNPTQPNAIVIDSLNPRNSGDVDWQDEVLRIAPQHKIDFAVRGGTDDVK